MLGISFRRAAIFVFFPVYIVILLEIFLSFEFWISQRALIAQSRGGILVVGDSILFNFSKNLKKKLEFSGLRVPVHAVQRYLLTADQYAELVVSLEEKVRPRVVITLFGAYSIASSEERKKILAQAAGFQSNFRSIAFLKNLYFEIIGYFPYTNVDMVDGADVDQNLGEFLKRFRRGQAEQLRSFLLNNSWLNNVENSRTFFGEISKIFTYESAENKLILVGFLKEYQQKIESELVLLAETGRKKLLESNYRYNDSVKNISMRYLALKRLQSHLYLSIAVLGSIRDGRFQNENLRDLNFDSNLAGFLGIELLVKTKSMEMKAEMRESIVNGIEQYFVNMNKITKLIFIEARNGLVSPLEPEGFLSKYEDLGLGALDGWQVLDSAIRVKLKLNESTGYLDSFEAVASDVITWSGMGIQVNRIAPVVSEYGMFEGAQFSDCELCQALRKRGEDFKKKTLNPQVVLLTPEQEKELILAYKKLLDQPRTNDPRFIILQYPGYSADNLKLEFSKKTFVKVVALSDLFLPLVKRDGYGEYFMDEITHLSGHFSAKGDAELMDFLLPKIVEEFNFGKSGN